MALELGLEGRKALVTGASEGIGRAVAQRLGAEGCALYLSARNEARLTELKAEIERDHGVPAAIFPHDLSVSADQAALAGACRDADILINGAGAIPKGRIDEIDEATWRAVWDLKVFGYINLCRHFYAFMKARGAGVIVNIIGNGGEKPVSDYIAGSTGNAALMAFTRALGGDSPKDGLRVVGLNPGPVATDKLISMMKKAARDQLGDADRYPEFMTGFGFGRAATTAEIADMAAFLASDLSAYTTGTIVTVDGGMINKGPLF
jgi:NAD(P)-dependent dehydrogenase (short-subunit alcohol dehydrogenase family)